MTLHVDDVPREEAAAVIDALGLGEDLIAALAARLFAADIAETLAALLRTVIIDEGIRSAIVDGFASVGQLCRRRRGDVARRFDETSVLVGVQVDFRADIEQLRRSEPADLQFA